MITLDEAIELMEAQVGELDGVIGVILYADDILQYLKEYRERQENLDQFETYQFEQNRPLTWQELQQMEGKPVWIENGGWKLWVIISHIEDPDTEYERLYTYGATCPLTLYKKHHTWQAYQKERTE